MRIGYVGLGRMGLRMVSRILKIYEVVAYDIDSSSVDRAVELGAEPAFSLEDLVKKLLSPRLIWIMVPAGKPVDSVVEGLKPHLERGDILIDGGNSFYKDSVRRAESLEIQGIHYLDIGTSGGLEGAEMGASLTVGGPTEAFRTVVPLLEGVARPGAYLHCGPSGAARMGRSTAAAGANPAEAADPVPAGTRSPARVEPVRCDPDRPFQTRPVGA